MVDELQTPGIQGIPLWDDNPAVVDLLGFDAVVAPVIVAVGMPKLDPLTIGIHGPWGGGKSTVLKLLAAELTDERYIVVTTNPWEYDNEADVCGTLIAQIIGELETRFEEDKGITDQIADLLKRISWSRVTLALAKGALTMQWKIDELVDAFTPKPKQEPETMAGFREAFGKLVSGLPNVERVVVLVDDLDRCLPNAVMAALEAIKLFLSVEKMVFVIAADQEMVRDAIAASLGSSARSERFAGRYLDKIVQLPVSLPRLALHEAEAYVALLLAHNECNDDQFAALVSHCVERRKQCLLPVLDELSGLEYRPSDDTLRLASQLAQGLGADRVTNPREIKRFLNAFSVRRQIAEARGIRLSPAVIAKLLLLEDRYRSDFERLAGTPESDRRQLLTKWEAWAQEGTGEPPNDMSEESKGWAASQPLLAEEELGPYITLAASIATVALAGLMGEELMELLARILGESRAVRDTAMTELAKRPAEEQRLLVSSILDHCREVEDVTDTIRSLVDISKASPVLAEEIASGIESRCYSRITPASALDLGGSEVPPLVALAKRLVDDPAADAGAREAARQFFEEGAS